jgi:GNAT superfamily N-acetyltransferase
MQTDLAGWLCEDAGKVVGFAMGDRSSGEVVVVAVRPEYEGQGIGHRVLTSLQEWLFAAGHAQLWLRANPDPAVRATGFYRKLGWVETGCMVGGDIVLELVAFRLPAAKSICLS